VLPIEQQVVFVTGASSGIGEATVRHLIAAGARVAFAARRVERIEALAREVDPEGARTLALAGDVTREEDRERWIEEIVARFGRLDALVNNAGYGQRGPVEQVPLDAIKRNFETNVFALVALVQRVIPVMRAQGGGRIVNIGSVAGKIARPMTSVYDSTKHAVEGLTDGLRGELKPFGIEVVLIRPGFIASEFVEASDRVSGAVLENPGPYAEFSQSFKGSARKLKKVAGTPSDVAGVVLRALRARHPRTHYAVPFHAKVFLLARRFLPVCLLDWAVRLRR
jgi:NAD(P)-dependent dehydrogenase (short-subunit alcohol dehydrogenase family)